MYTTEMYETSAYILSVGDIYYDSSGLMGYQVHQRVVNNNDWWRCDSCGRAVPFKVDGKLLLKCPDCAASIPKRYDK